VTMQSSIKRNVMFNGPRALINFNDGFGGGAEISENLLHNACRESSDHGPFNSWDRQVFGWEKSDDGILNLIPMYNRIHHNFIIANYGSGMAIDNDDGSSYYDIHDNVFYEGGGMKSDYAGHDKLYHHNLNVGHDVICGNYMFYRPNHTDHCYSNVGVMSLVHAATGKGIYADLWSCDITQSACGASVNGVIDMYNNTVYNFNTTCDDDYSTNGCAVQCGPSGSPSEMWSRSKLREKCPQIGSGDKLISTMPSADDISEWAKAILSMD